MYYYIFRAPESIPVATSITQRAASTPQGKTVHIAYHFTLMAHTQSKYGVVIAWTNSLCLQSLI